VRLSEVLVKFIFSISCIYFVTITQSLLAVPNVKAHPSTASVPITVLLYDGPLLCGFNLAIKGLNSAANMQ